MGRFIDELSKEEKQAIIHEMIDKRNRVNNKLWDDIAKDYDLELTGDALRKLAFGVDFAIKAGLQFEVGDHMDKGFVERQKMYDIQRQIRRDMREFSRTELICEHIGKAIKELPTFSSNEKKTKKTNSNRSLVIGIGDFHYGAEFIVTGLYGETLNSYNSNVFKQRMHTLLDEIEEISNKENPKEIVVMIAGDMLDGMLRNTQLQRLEYGVIDSAMNLAETLTYWLIGLKEKVNIPVRVYAVRGNHGELRPLGSKAGQFPEENMERIVMHYLHARLSNEKWITISDDAPLTEVVEISGYQFLLTHGQNMNINTLAKDCINLYQKPIDVFMIGHLHKNQSFVSGIMPNSNIYVERVPSLCGMDPYAQIKGYNAHPGATIMLMEEGYGVKCVYPIILK